MVQLLFELKKRTNTDGRKKVYVFRSPVRHYYCGVSADPDWSVAIASFTVEDIKELQKACLKFLIKEGNAE